jgi:hypothetical protein
MNDTTVLENGTSMDTTEKKYILKKNPWKLIQLADYTIQPNQIFETIVQAGLIT